MSDVREHASPCSFPKACAACVPCRICGRAECAYKQILCNYRNDRGEQCTLVQKHPEDHSFENAGRAAPGSERSPLQDVCFKCGERRASHRFDRGCSFEAIVPNRPAPEAMTFTMAIGNPYVPHDRECGALECVGDHLLFTWCTLEPGHAGKKHSSKGLNGDRREWEKAAYLFDRELGWRSVENPWK